MERITTFADAGCSAPLCVLELFARRKDRLERRQAWLGPEQRVTLSTFGPGAASCVKSIRVTRAAQPACGDTPSAGSAAAAPRRQGEGVQVELTFFSDRPDGLMR